MTESLRTTQIAFFRFATPCGFFQGERRRGTKSIRARVRARENPMKPFVRTSFLGTRPSCLPSPGWRFFDKDGRKPNLWLGLPGSPVNISKKGRVCISLQIYLARLPILWLTRRVGSTTLVSRYRRLETGPIDSPALQPASDETSTCYLIAAPKLWNDFPFTLQEQSLKEATNIKWEMVLSPDDEEVANSSKKHTQFKTRVHKPYPISDQNGRNWYSISDQNG